MAEDVTGPQTATDADALQRAEQAWQEHERLLRVAISRVTLAVTGGNSELDLLLDALRKASRGTHNFDELQNLVDQLTVKIKELDERRGRGRRIPEKPSWLQRLFAAPAPTSSPATHNTAVFVAQLIAHLEKTRPQWPGLARLHPLRNETSAERVLSTLCAELGNASAADAAALEAHLPELFISLLEHLEFPAELRERANALRERLEKTAMESNQMIVATADLIMELRSSLQAENQDLQMFLQQLTEGLRELDELLQDERALSYTCFDSNAELNAKVATQMRDLEDSVEQTVDITELKSTIQQRLDNIRRHLLDHHEEDLQSRERMEQQQQLLSQRLLAMERESVQLRERLQEKHEQAMEDIVTGIHNRHAYEERISQEYLRWKRYQKPLVMLVLDVDHFKSINDNYGHKAGDKALQLIARILQENLRATDFLARYGGEEFVAVMPETELDAAGNAAQKLRAAVEHCQFHHQGTRVPITISCGIAAFHERDTPETVFRRADTALYQAKQQGRNRCCTESLG